MNSQEKFTMQKIISLFISLFFIVGIYANECDTTFLKKFDEIIEKNKAKNSETAIFLNKLRSFYVECDLEKINNSIKNVTIDIHIGPSTKEFLKTLSDSISFQLVETDHSISDEVISEVNESEVIQDNSSKITSENKSNWFNFTNITLLLLVLLIVILFLLSVILFNEIKTLKNNLSDLKTSSKTKYAQYDEEISEFKSKIGQFNKKIEDSKDNVASLKKDIDHKIQKNIGNTSNLSPSQPHRSNDVKKETLSQSVIKYSANPDGEGIIREKDLADKHIAEIFIFEIKIQNDNQNASFKVVENTESQEYAIEKYKTVLIDACDFLNTPNNSSKIITETLGKMVKEGDKWRITNKAKIKFL